MDIARSNKKDDAGQKVTYSKTISKGNSSTTVRVEEVENGFITTITKDKEVDGNLDYSTKQYISKNNPIKNMDEFDKIDDDIKDEDLFKDIQL